jgi:hypothetical protein
VAKLTTLNGEFNLAQCPVLQIRKESGRGGNFRQNLPVKLYGDDFCCLLVVRRGDLPIVGRLLQCSLLEP